MQYDELLSLNWSWSTIIQKLNDTDTHITSTGRWYLMKLLTKLVGLHQYQQHSNISSEENRQLIMEKSGLSEPSLSFAYKTKQNKTKHTKHAIVAADITSNLAA